MGISHLLVFHSGSLTQRLINAIMFECEAVAVCNTQFPKSDFCLDFFCKQIHNSRRTLNPNTKRNRMFGLFFLLSVFSCFFFSKRIIIITEQRQLIVVLLDHFPHRYVLVLEPGQFSLCFVFSLRASFSRWHED